MASVEVDPVKIDYSVALGLIEDRMVEIGWTHKTAMENILAAIDTAMNDGFLPGLTLTMVVDTLKAMEDID